MWQGDMGMFTFGSIIALWKLLATERWVTFGLVFFLSVTDDDGRGVWRSMEARMLCVTLGSEVVGRYI
jgi:hypothetical protein